MGLNITFGSLKLCEETLRHHRRVIWSCGGLTVPDVSVATCRMQLQGLQCCTSERCPEVATGINASCLNLGSSESCTQCEESAISDLSVSGPGQNSLRTVAECTSVSPSIQGLWGLGSKPVHRGCCCPPALPLYPAPRLRAWGSRHRTKEKGFGVSGLGLGV